MWSTLAAEIYRRNTSSYNCRIYGAIWVGVFVGSVIIVNLNAAVNAAP